MAPHAHTQPRTYIYLKQTAPTDNKHPKLDDKQTCY